MYSIVSTAIIRGINSLPVQVEADVSDGMPMFEMVGFLASEVKEARERVRAALRNSGCRLPAKRITVNLSPANIKKTGSAFDLPVAAELLQIWGKLLAVKGYFPGRGCQTLLRRCPGLVPGGKHVLTAGCGRRTFAGNVLHGGLVDLVPFNPVSAGSA